MLATVILASVMAGAVMSLLHAVRAGDRAMEVISKIAASTAFVIVGFVRWSPDNPVNTWLIAALMLCAIGDVCLLWQRFFDVGLVSFLVGHLAYGAGFATALPLSLWPVLILVPLTIAAASVLRWLWPYLGRRRIPVTGYVIVISIMVWGGFAGSLRDALPWSVAAGALLFYLSDLAVARQRFVHKDFVNRAVGLPTYYLGQLFLAMSIGAG